MSRRSMLVVILGLLASMVAAVSVSVAASDRAIRENEERNRQARVEGHRASCLLINSQVNVYREEPPMTPAGKKAAEAWEEMRRVFACP